MLVVPYIDKDSIDLTLEQYRSSDNQFLNYWKAVREEINKL
jgi:preprotein translocase subunit SecE